MVSCSTLLLVEDVPTNSEMLSECKAEHLELYAIEGCLEDYYKSLAAAEVMVILGYVFGFSTLIVFATVKKLRRRKELHNE